MQATAVWRQWGWTKKQSAINRYQLLFGQTKFLSSLVLNFIINNSKQLRLSAGRYKISHRTPSCKTLEASNSEALHQNYTMMFRRLFILVFSVTIFSWQKGHTQKTELTTQENKFVQLYSQVFESLRGDWKTTKSLSDKFSNELINFIKSTPSTLTFPFKKLTASNEVFIRTSNDGNLRIYSWDAWTGGTMHEYNTIYQWKANGKVFSKVEKFEKQGDPGIFISQLHTVDANNQRYYLAVTNATYSNKDARQSIATYSINNGKLVDSIKLFKTKTKRLNRIDVDFDFFSVVDRPERPLQLITYDDSQKIIYIPVVDDKGQVTNKNILYQLKGTYFEFIGIETGKRK